MSEQRFRVMSMRDAVKFANKHDVEVKQVWRRGEYDFYHPSWGKRVRVNSRKKDAPLILVRYLMRLRN